MLDLDLNQVVWAILVLFGALTILSNSINSIVKAYDTFQQRKPSNEINAKLKQHDDKLSEHDVKIKELSKNMDTMTVEYECDRKMMLKSLSALIQHACGNVSIEHMKEISEELQEHILK